MRMERYAGPLADFLPFACCLGVPLPQGSIHPHALFLFFDQPSALSDYVENMTEATALAASALLERRMVFERSMEMQRLALTGTMMQGLVHEINNMIGPMNLHLDLLHKECAFLQEMVAAGQSIQDGKSLQKAAALLGNVRSRIKSLAETTDMFGHLAVHDREEPVQLNPVVVEALHMLDDLAQEHDIELLHEPADRLVTTRARPTQVQQIVLNVLLNAIQQRALAYPNEKGQVLTRITRIRQRGQLWVRVTVEDDGPGIHRGLWERIFELGFTTREGQGSGLGLYIARRLVEDIGGQMRVAESDILWGTQQQL